LGGENAVLGDALHSDWFLAGGVFPAREGPGTEATKEASKNLSAFKPDFFEAEKRINGVEFVHLKRRRSRD
jgi:hypothetical protein